VTISQRGLTLSLAIMAALVACIFLMRPWVHGAGAWAALAMVAVALTAGAASTVVWWRNIDEAAREAHKSAWYWGGLAGLAVCGALIMGLLVFGVAPPLLLASKASPTGYFVSGMLALMFILMAGYAVAWVVWWVRR